MFSKTLLSDPGRQDGPLGFTDPLPKNQNKMKQTKTKLKMC